ncbi:hypothetical protein [Nitrosomonas sp. Nm34]|uniref:hypothetical protein n=1 Tax=Nitrosomonas sp. Nm34 TaxID=1881055 RepID=UPI0008E5B3D1|nr:hypothetical protein [Nitrosomonas sp. Nm34]SFI25021.1 hypothetical protein SAMN05428978_100355 [Nitrosomonas sp. Nm34]
MNRKNRCISSRYHLTDQEFAELEFEHRHTTDKRYVGRVKAVYLLEKRVVGHQACTSPVD